MSISKFKPLINLAIRSLALILKFFSVLLMAKNVNPEILGQYNYQLYLIFLCVYVLGFELYYLNNRKVLSTQVKKNIDFYINKHLSTILLLCTSVVLIGAPCVAYIWGIRLLVIFPIVIYGEGIFNEIYRLLNITNKNIQSSAYLLLRNFSTLVFFYLLSQENLCSVSTLLTGYFLPAFILSVIFLLKIKFQFIFVRPKQIFKEIVKTRLVFLSSVSARLQQFLDKYFILLMQSASLVAAYTFYQNITNAIITLLESGIFLFAMNHLYSMKDLYSDEKELKRYIKKLLVKISAVYLLSSIFVYIGLYFFVHKINRIYVDNMYLLGATTIAAFFIVLSYPFHLMLYFKKSDRQLLIININSLFFFLIIGFLYRLYPSFMLLITMIISYNFFQFVFKYYYAWTKINYK